MRIAVVGGRMLGFGGTETHIYQLCEYLRRSRHDVVPIIGPENSIQILEEKGFEVRKFGSTETGGHVWPRLKNFYLKAPWQLLRALWSTRDVDMIHVHTNDDFWHFTIAASAHNIPCVLTCHGHNVLVKPYRLQWRNLLYNRMVRSGMKKAHGILIISDYVWDSIKGFYIEEFENPTPASTRTWEKIYLTPDIEPRRTRLRKKLNGKIRLATASRITKHKRIDVVIQSLPALIQAGYDVQLSVWGGGPPDEFEALQELVNRLGLGDRVLFEGFGKVEDITAECDIFIVPTSDDEPFSLGKIEGLRLGMPTVCFDGGGGADGMKDGVTCRVARSGDPASLAAVLTNLIEDNDQRLGIAETGYRESLEVWDPARMWRDIDYLYKHAQQRHGRIRT